MKIEWSNVDFLERMGFFEKPKFVEMSLLPDPYIEEKIDYSRFGVDPKYFSNENNSGMAIKVDNLI